MEAEDGLHNLISLQTLNPYTKLHHTIQRNTNSSQNPYSHQPHLSLHFHLGPTTVSPRHIIIPIPIPIPKCPFQTLISPLYQTPLVFT